MLLFPIHADAASYGFVYILLHPSSSSLGLNRALFAGAGGEDRDRDLLPSFILVIANKIQPNSASPRLLARDLHTWYSH
jgi:hypothetical protein